MQPIICTKPMELVHIDYVGMEVTVATDKKPVVKNILMVIDHFTQYVQAFVTKNHTARTTARVLYNNYFSVFGFPQCLMSDQGTEFCGKVIVAMCSLLGVKKIWTTPYHLRPTDWLREYTRHYNADRQTGPGEKEEVAGPHRIDHHCLQFN